jgi:hypothetical protein
MGILILEWKWRKKICYDESTFILKNPINLSPLCRMPNYRLHHHFPPSNPFDTKFLAESDFFGKNFCNDFFGIASSMTSKPDLPIPKPLKFLDQVRQVIRVQTHGKGYRR